LSDADLNAVSGGMMNQDTALFRPFVAGAARGYGGEFSIGNVCSSGNSTVTVG
jgi:hypothetical protein